jgi:hypothetical protein
VVREAGKRVTGAAERVWRGALIGSVILNGALAIAAVGIASMDMRYGVAGPPIVVAALAVFAVGGAMALLRRWFVPQRRRWAWLVASLAPMAFVVMIGANALPLWWPVWAGGRPLFALITPGPAALDDVRLFSLPDAGRLRLLGAEGVRVMIRPSFGEVDYDIYLSRGGLDIPSKAKALVRVVSKHGAPREYQFDIPDEDLMVTLDAYDLRARRWMGETGLGADGTAIFVERVRDGAITSMHSNSNAGWSPGNPAVQLGSDVLRLMLAYGPSGVFPRSYDWHVSAGEHADYPCAGYDLNGADPDGFGVGADACAQFKRGRISGH